MEELDNLMVDLVKAEQDNIFKALMEDIVLFREEVFEVIKDDFFI